jgi:cbb3-type cytochrome oxidase maturation protein
VIVVYVVIWSSAVILGLTAVWALVWAIRTGQFHGLRQGAESIFDAAEPIGVPTDAFPQARPSTNKRKDELENRRSGSEETPWQR